MSRDPEDVPRSRSAKEIKAYCKTLANELGLTLDYVLWGRALPDNREDRYNLTVSIVKPFQADPQFWFTAEKVRGYAKDTTKAAIEHEIRHELEG